MTLPNDLCFYFLCIIPSAEYSDTNRKAQCWRIAAKHDQSAVKTWTSSKRGQPDKSSTQMRSKCALVRNTDNTPLLSGANGVMCRPMRLCYTIYIYQVFEPYVP